MKKKKPIDEEEEIRSKLLTRPVTKDTRLGIAKIKVCGIHGVSGGGNSRLTVDPAPRLRAEIINSDKM
ncbi:hypothetical protein YC2023_016189 [Brassica napus]